MYLTQNFLKPTGKIQFIHCYYSAFGKSKKKSPKLHLSVLFRPEGYDFLYLAGKFLLTLQFMNCYFLWRGATIKGNPLMSTACHLYDWVYIVIFKLVVTWIFRFKNYVFILISFNYIIQLIIKTNSQRKGFDT